MKILLIEDEPGIARLIRRGLTDAGYLVEATANGRQGMEMLGEKGYSLLLLDLMVPGLDGWQVCEALRAQGSQIPILMLTARDTVPDRVRGLDLGADDYLPKPFEFPELLARVRSLLRRASTGGEKLLRYADLIIDPTSRETRRGDRAVALSPKEFDLLTHLLRHPRQVLPRERILEAVWGYDFEGEDNVLDVYIGYLRAKTEADGEARLIQTVRGRGFRVAATIAAPADDPHA